MFARRQLGVCSWTFGDLPLGDIAERVAELGYDGVELLGDLGRYTAVSTNQILTDHNLQVFALTPTNVDLAHPDTAVRQQAIDYYKKLIDFAAELGDPLVVVRGFVGRTQPVTSLEEEHDLLATAVQQLAVAAQARGLRLVIELLNRYESHLINLSVTAVDFLKTVAHENVGLLQSAFHMNIEEQDASAALHKAGSHLWLYHMADSNRQGIGRGHIKFGPHLWALDEIGYSGPIIMECTVHGSDFLNPIKAEALRAQLEKYLRESRSWF